MKKDTSTTSTVIKAGKTKRRGGWKKPKDKPKRPLCAYNIFFKEQRQLMKQEGKVSFTAMGKAIAAKWRKMDGLDRIVYAKLAMEEKLKYQSAIAEWKHKKLLQKSEVSNDNCSVATVSSANDGSVTSADESNASDFEPLPHQEFSDANLAESYFFENQEQHKQDHLQTHNGASSAINLYSFNYQKMYQVQEQPNTSFQGEGGINERITSNASEMNRIMRSLEEFPLEEDIGDFISNLFLSTTSSSMVSSDRMILASY